MSDKAKNSAYFTGIITQYINEDSPSSTEKNKEEALSLIMKMLDKSVSTDECLSKTYRLLNSALPAEKVAAIIQLSEDSRRIILKKEGSIAPSRRKQCRRWNAGEDQKLLAGILRFGLDWPNVALFVGNGMNKFQCAQRWNRVLNPAIVKGPWSTEEEIKLVDLVRSFGDRSWITIAKNMDSRSDVQCRYHYHQMVRKKREILKDNIHNSNIANDNAAQKQTPKIMNMFQNEGCFNLFNFEDNSDNDMISFNI